MENGSTAARALAPNPVFLSGIGSGSGFKISLHPDPVSAPNPRAKKSAEWALELIFKRQLKNYDEGPSNNEKKEPFLIKNNHKID